MAALAAAVLPASAAAADDAVGDEARREARLIARCAGAIARAAGAGARLVELGGGSSAGADALRAALGTGADARGRRVVRVPAARVRGLDAAALAALLGRIAAMSEPDALLVVGTGCSAREPSRPDSADAAASACRLARFERLADAGGWRHLQLWVDGGARVALHVLERTIDTEP